jgi:hypothetical protein
VKPIGLILLNLLALLHWLALIWLLWCAFQ